MRCVSSQDQSCRGTHSYGAAGGELTLSPEPQEGTVHDEQSEDVRNSVKDLTGLFAMRQWGAEVIYRDHGRTDL